MRRINHVTEEYTYVHPCIRGVTPIDSIVTATTALSQRSNHPNKCSQWSKWSRSTFKSHCGMDQISAAIRSEPGGGVTHARNANIQAHRLRLQFKYRDVFAGKISERSKVNGQKLVWSTVKLSKRAGQSFDPRSQL